MKKINHWLFLPIFLLLVLGCQEDDPQAQMPFVPVDIEINLQDLRYQELHTNGWMYLNGGIKGLIIVKESPSVYRALDRACPYHPTDPCAKVDVHSSGFYLIDDCCGSRFEKTGNVTSGPAQQPLLQYNTYQNGNYLIIRN